MKERKASSTPRQRTPPPPHPMGFGAVMRRVGQNGLSRELCGIIGLDYSFKREAYVKEERALQSRNGPFLKDYHNGNFFFEGNE